MQVKWKWYESWHLSTNISLYFEYGASYGTAIVTMDDE